MNYKSKGNMAKLLIIVAILMCLPFIFVAQSLKPKLKEEQKPVQSLDSKLAQKTTFVPQSKLPLEQLIEVAKHYGIPMGIEWHDQPDARTDAGALVARAGDVTVRELLEAILRQSPSHVLTVENSMVHIAPPALAANPKNLLNLRIEEFHLEKENLFYAGEQLRIAIDAKLHPEEYEGGYMGGFGYTPDHVFAVDNVTFSGKNLTVREILDGLAKANGNALWTVQLSPLGLAADQTSPQSNDEGEGDKFQKFWKFIPLDLKEEQESLIVELMIEECPSAKGIKVPIDISRVSGGSKAGGFTDSTGCRGTYGISVSKLHKASVVLHVEVKTEKNGFERAINKEISVPRGKASEHQFANGIAIKTYLELPQGNSTR